MSASSSSAQRGFTLLELLAVVALIAIVSTVTAIAVAKSLERARVHEAANRLLLDLRYVRSLAMARGHTEDFTLDVNTGTFRAPSRAPDRLPASMKVSITSAKLGRAPTVVSRIRFFPDGSSTGGRIDLRRGSMHWEIRVSWLTGVAALQHHGGGG